VWLPGAELGCERRSAVITLGPPWKLPGACSGITP